MPCSDGYGPTDIYERLNAATRAACELARALRNSFSEKGMPRSVNWDALSKETKRWVEKHDKMDAARIKQEREEKRRKKLKKEALKKLSKKEREALNL